MISCLHETELIRLGLIRLGTALGVSLRSSRSSLLLLHAHSGGEELFQRTRIMHT